MHVFAELQSRSGFICWKQKRIGVISTTSTEDESHMTALYWLSFQPRHLLLLSVPLSSRAMQNVLLLFMMYQYCWCKQHCMKELWTCTKQFLLLYPIFLSTLAQPELGWSYTYLVSRSQHSLGICLTLLWQLPSYTIHRLFQESMVIEWSEWI